MNYHLQRLLVVYNTTLVPRVSSTASTTSPTSAPLTTPTISLIRKDHPKMYYSAKCESFMVFSEAFRSRIFKTCLKLTSTFVQNYAVCIRVENGYCGIRYSQVSNDIYSFTVSGDTAANNFMLTSPEVKYGDTDCRNDYIIIPGGSDNGVNNEFSRDRHLTFSFCSKINIICHNHYFLDFVATP